MARYQISVVLLDDEETKIITELRTELPEVAAAALHSTANIIFPEKPKPSLVRTGNPIGPTSSGPVVSGVGEILVT